MTKEKRMKRKQVRKQSRFSQGNTPNGWKKARDIFGWIAGIGGSILAVAATGGIALPAVALTWIGTGTTIAGIIAGRSALARDKKLIDNDK